MNCKFSDNCPRNQYKWWKQFSYYLQKWQFSEESAEHIKMFHWWLYLAV